MGDELARDFRIHRRAELGLERQVQKVEIERVSSKIAKAIIAYFGAFGVGFEFHAADLQQHVVRVLAKQGQFIAPASADRIMRDLATKQTIGYTVVNRRQSLYRIDKVKS